MERQNNLTQPSLEQQITVSGDEVSQIKAIAAAVHEHGYKAVVQCLDDCYRKEKYDYLSCLSHIPDNELSREISFQIIWIFREYISICGRQAVKVVFDVAEKCHRLAGQDAAGGVALEMIETYLHRYPEDIHEAITHCERKDPYNNGSQFVWRAALGHNVKANIGKFLSWLDNAKTDEEIAIAMHTLTFVPEKISDVSTVANEVTDRIVKMHGLCLNDTAKGELYRAGEAWRKVVDGRHGRILEEIACKLLGEGNPTVLYWATQEAAFSVKQQSEKDVDAFLVAFSKIDPIHKGSIENLSFYLQKLLNVCPGKVFAFIETYCRDHSCNVTIFNGLIHAIANCDETFRNRYLTRWLSSDSMSDAGNVHEIVSGVRPGKTLMIRAVFDSCEECTDEILLFLFLRAIGWLYLMPETCVGFLVSCACQMRKIECLKSIYGDFFYLVILNYLDEYKQTLDKIPACDRRTAVFKYLKKLELEGERWWKRLKDAGELPELSPSIRHKELHAKRQKEVYGKAMEEVQKNSLLSQIAHNVFLLHGRGSITPVYTAEGESLQESLLQHFSASVRIPMLSEIEGHTLAIRLLELRRVRREECT